MSQLQKLTLAVPRKTAIKAKSYARRHGTSVSSLVTRFFRSINELESGPETAGQKGDLTAAVTRSCVGVISLPNKKKAQLITDALAEKFSRK